MAIIKSCTDIEQSKKLAEFLPLKSADMDYIPITNLDGEYSVEVNEWDNEHVIEEGWIPCWSLSALLNVLPRIEHLKPFIDLGPKLHSDEVAIYYYSEDSPYIVRDNPVDACYEMVLKLHEMNLL